MKTWTDFVWLLLIALLVIFFGGWILGGVVNIVALTSPQMQSMVFCPSESKVSSNSNEGIILCKDKNGNFVPALSDGDSIALQRKYFYRPSYFVMLLLLIAWYIRSSSQNRIKARAD